MPNYQHGPTLLSPLTKVLQFSEFVILSEAKDLHFLRVREWPVRSRTESLPHAIPKHGIELADRNILITAMSLYRLRRLAHRIRNRPVNLATFVPLTRSPAFKAD